MSGEQEELYSYDPTALADYEPQYQQSPQTVGVRGRLNTPPHPASPRVSISILPPGPTVGVGTNMNPADHITVLVGGTNALGAQAGHLPTPADQNGSTVRYKTPARSTTNRKGKQPAKRPTTGGKEPDVSQTFLPQRWW